MVIKSSGNVKAGKCDVPLWEGTALAGWLQKLSLGDRHSSGRLKEEGESHHIDSKRRVSQAESTSREETSHWIFAGGLKSIQSGQCAERKEPPL